VPAFTATGYAVQAALSGGINRTDAEGIVLGFLLAVPVAIVPNADRSNHP
jgi:hypothetical protein